MLPSRLMMNATSADNALREAGLNCNAICRTMFCRYTGYGKLIPSTFTFATSPPPPPSPPALGAAAWGGRRHRLRWRPRLGHVGRRARGHAGCLHRRYVLRRGCGLFSHRRRRCCWRRLRRRLDHADGTLTDRRGDETHAIRRRQRHAGAAAGKHERRQRSHVQKRGGCNGESHGGDTVRERAHRTISGSVTNPTSLTPAARIVAITCAITPYGTLASPRR